MKVVRPEWLVSSVATGALLPWTDFIYQPVSRLEDSQGQATAQKSLLGFASQVPSRTTHAPRSIISQTGRAADSATTSLVDKEPSDLVPPRQAGRAAASSSMITGSNTQPILRSSQATITYAAHSAKKPETACFIQYKGLENCLLDSIPIPIF